MLRDPPGPLSGDRALELTDFTVAYVAKFTLRQLAKAVVSICWVAVAVGVQAIPHGCAWQDWWQHFPAAGMQDLESGVGIDDMKTMQEWVSTTFGSGHVLSLEGEGTSREYPLVG